MRALQVLEVAMASNNHNLGVRVGRSVFCKPTNPFDLGEGYEAWTGLFQAAILGEQPFLNVDIAHKSFPSSMTLIEYLKRENCDPNYEIDRRCLYNITAFLKNIDILYEPPPSFGAVAKRYRVLEIGQPAEQLKFRLDDGSQMTVVEYFKSKGCRLQYPKLNCLKVGSTVRSIALPMEFCSIVEGQALNVSVIRQQICHGSPKSQH